MVNRKTVYIGASFLAKPEAQELAQLFMRQGYLVTSTWLWYKNYLDLDTETLDKSIQGMDVQGVLAADLVVILTDIPSTKGGFYTELGIALGKAQPTQIVSVGLNPRPNGFFSGIKNYPTIEEFKEAFDLK